MQIAPKNTGPAADFSSWFAGNVIDKIPTGKENPAYQETKLGLIYEIFRRDPKVLREKRRQFEKAQPGWILQASEVDNQWLLSPLYDAAFRVWDRPWTRLRTREKAPLFQWVRAGGKGPPDVALRVDRVKIKGPLESDVCKYVPTKDPSDSDRYLMETDPSLEKQGWRLFAVDCRSKDSVKRACSWIMSNYAKTGSRGRHSLASWRKRLSNWNFDLFPQGNAKVALTMEWLTRMEDAWEKHDLASVAINLDR